LKIYSM